MNKRHQLENYVQVKIKLICVRSNNSLTKYRVDLVGVDRTYCDNRIKMGRLFSGWNGKLRNIYDHL